VNNLFVAGIADSVRKIRGMGKYLTAVQLENLKNYKYSASNWSFIDKQLAAYWEFCVTLLPLWLA
jgi:hypothetical protein